MPASRRCTVPLALLAVAATAFAGDEVPYAPFVAPASDEGKKAMAGFTVPKGISLELFAAEPLLANPVSFAIDERGNAYVCETFRHHAGVTDMRDHMDWLDDELSNRTVEDRVRMMREREGEKFHEKYEVEHERVRLVRDTDGDGFADAATVFADGFKDAADGIGAGLLARKGDVYYTNIPHLWLLRDRDGDGRADERRALSSGYGVHIALLGHDLHGLRVGPDGRLYFSIGDRGFFTSTPEGVLDHSHTGAVLRCDLDGSNLEIVHTGLRNPQELAFDDYGDLFTGDNNSDGGDRARWVQIVPGADSGWRFHYQYVESPVSRGPWNDEKLWVPHFDGQAAWHLPPIMNLADGPSGLTHYPGTGFGDAWTNTFFLCDFRGTPSSSGIHAIRNAKKGAGFEVASLEKFLWGSLVTDCDFGPDGALYFSDWVYGWNKLGKGRLYRAVDPEARSSAIVRETRDLLATGMGGRPVAALASLLGHADQRVRLEAELELAARGSEGAAALEAAAVTFSESFLARLHGVWGLGIVGRRDPAALATVHGLLRDRAPEIRAQAAKVLGDARHAPAADDLTAALADASARVRFQAALALARLAHPGAVDALFRLAEETGESDPPLRHAAIEGLARCAPVPRLLGAAAHPSKDVRIAAVVALRRLRHPGIARFLRDAEPLVVLEAARAIHDAPIPLATAALAETIPDVPLDSPAALLRRVLAANERVGTRERATEVALFAASAGADAALRAEALASLSSWGEPSPRDRVLGEWRPHGTRDDSFVPDLVRLLFDRGIADAPASVAEAWIALAAGRRLAEYAPAFLSWLESSARPATTRLASFRAIDALEAANLETAVRVALNDTDGRVRAAALEAMPKVSPAEALPLLERVLDDGEIAERRTAYRLLGGLEEKRAGDVLRGELEKALAELVPAELRLDLLLAAEKRGRADLDAIAGRLRASRPAGSAISRYVDGLFGGDADRGKEIFHNLAEVKCLRCHTVDLGAPQQVGPSLAGVGSRLTRLQMLEAIVEPNRKILRGYATTILALTEDRVAIGRIVEETSEKIRLEDADGKIVEIPAAEVEARKPGLSAMPEDLASHLDRERMRDLLEYLARLR